MLNDNVTNDNSDNGGLPPPPSFAHAGKPRPALSPLSLVIIVIKDFGCHCHRPLPQSRIYAQAFQRLEMLPGGPCRAHFSQHGGRPAHEVRENPCTDGRSVLPLQRIRTTAAAPSGPNGCKEQSSRPVKALLSGRQKPQLTLAPSVLRHPPRFASSIGGRAD